jgi:hypothetical protein
MIEITDAEIAAAQASSPAIEYGWEHVAQTIFEARLNLLRRQAGLQQTLAIYNDPEDYRREGWTSELATVQHNLARIEARLTATYEAAIFASDCGNCSPHRNHPHAAHTSSCPCGCQRTMRVKEVRP